MTYPLVVVGAGGFGREVLDVVSALNADGDGPTLVGALDDAPNDAALRLLENRRVAYLGTVDDWLRSRHDSERYVIAIGDPPTRRRIAHTIQRHGPTPATLVHPRATIGTGSLLSPGTVICAGALVSTNVRCGAHAHLNPGSIIGHDVTLESYCSINPGAIVSGNATIGSGATLGAGSTTLQNLRVGEGAIVGAGAVVTRDVPSYETVMGIPARSKQPSEPYGMTDHNDQFANPPESRFW